MPIKACHDCFYKALVNQEGHELIIMIRAVSAMSRESAYNNYNMRHVFCLAGAFWVWVTSFVMMSLFEELFLAKFPRASQAY